MTPPTPDPAGPRAGRPARLVGWVLLALLWAAAFEGLARGFWLLRSDVPLGEPGRVIEAFYPELRQLDPPPAPADGQLDLLLLGGSTLHEGWGQVEVELRERLTRAGHRVRTFNLAQPSHTSRDSRLKYAAAGEARFDRVIVYHGINDARANNAPPEVFRDDYGHFAWYEGVNAVAGRAGRSRFALPASAHLAWLRVRQALVADPYASLERPRADWVQYGGELRSAGPFEANLRAILERAATRGDRPVLMTYALWIPEDSSLEGFRRRTLDYLLYYSPVELWGAPPHVRAAIDAHNEIVRRLASETGALLVDQDRHMPRGRRWFNDPCHLTLEGSAVFAERLVDALLRTSAPAPPGAG